MGNNDENFSLEPSRETPKVVFVTHLPCPQCAKRLVNLGGVKVVHYWEDYRLRDAEEILKRAGIPLLKSAAA